MSITKTPASMIDPSGATNGQVLTFNGSTNTWGASSLSASGFAASLATNGYSKLPNGIIMQWGESYLGDVSGDSSLAINFPTTFPNACLQVIPSLKAAGASNVQDCAVSVIGTPTTTQFTASIQEWSGTTQAVTITFISIGY